MSDRRLGTRAKLFTIVGVVLAAGLGVATLVVTRPAFRNRRLIALLEDRATVPNVADHSAWASERALVFRRSHAGKMELETSWIGHGPAEDDLVRATDLDSDYTRRLPATLEPPAPARIVGLSRVIVHYSGSTLEALGKLRDESCRKTATEFCEVMASLPPHDDDWARVLKPHVEEMRHFLGLP